MSADTVNPATTDDVDAARDYAVLLVAGASDEWKWTPTQADEALADVSAAHAESTGFFGTLGSFIVADIGETVQADQVEGFWEKLAARAELWPMLGSTQVRAAIAAALAANREWTENGTQTPLDVAGNVGDAVVDTSEDIKKAAEEGTLLPVILIGAGVALAAALAFSFGRR